MRIKIGDTWYDSTEVAICVELDEVERTHIKEMAPDSNKYAQFPSDTSMSTEQKFEWMDAPVVNDQPVQVDTVASTIGIYADNLPTGTWYEHDGSAWTYERYRNSNGWRHVPANLKAFEKGEPNSDLVDHLPFSL